MPTNRRFRTRRRRDLQLDETAELSLFRGLHFFDFDEEEHRRAVWEKYGPSLLARWIEEHPGTRPWAWWAYDAPAELRRRVQVPEEELSEYDRHHLGVAETNGPEAFADEPPSFGIPKPFAPDSLLFEPEADYLERHGLIGPAERRAMEARHE